jgi:hypothetical protein
MDALSIAIVALYQFLTINERYITCKNNTSKTCISMLEATVLRKTCLKLYLGFIQGKKLYRT